MLTRNVKLQASADAAEAPFYGGHVMAMGTSKMFVEGVEIGRASCRERVSECV